MGSHSGQGGFSLVTRLSGRELLEGLPRWYHFVFIALACVAVLLPAIVVFFHHAISKPVDSMVRGLRSFGEGDADARMALRPEEEEFCVLKREFNQMADQIKTLRLDVYEEALERQKAELQYLEMQINPHFFLNALNGIYAFAVANNMEMVRKMILLLSGYLRQSFQSSFAVIPLRDELEHTRRYLELQQIRFQGRISAEIVIPGFLLDAPVPALCLHTFVDNAVKHQSAPPDGLHIGIWNFRRRLDILYRGAPGCTCPMWSPTARRRTSGCPPPRREGMSHAGADCGRRASGPGMRPGHDRLGSRRGAPCGHGPERRPG